MLVRGMCTESHRVEVFDTIIELTVGRGGESRRRSAGATGGAHVVIDVMRMPGWRNDRSDLGVRSVGNGAAARRIVIERPFLSGSFAPAPPGFHGAFTVGGEGDALLEGLVSFGLSLVCEERGDLLLHASAVARGGQAWIFLGPGGSGKTTIAAELNGGRTPLCVDKALVSARPDGALRVHATPFGDGFDNPPRTGAAAIAGLFFIEQAQGHEIVPLSRWEATNRLLGQTMTASRDPSSVQRTMDAIGRLADLDVAFQLRFRKDTGFWPLVEDALSKG